MLFGSSTIQHLLADHRRIREYLEVMLDHKRDNGSVKLAFAGVLPLFISHNHREEKVIYAFLESQGEDLRRMAIEGDEEHAILDGLVEELHDFTLSSEEWVLKAKIFAELLGHHFDGEEREMFPKLKKILTDELDEKLSAEYNGRSVKQTPPLSSVFH